MTFLQSLTGMLAGELTAAEPGRTLQTLNDRGIRLYDVEAAGELAVRFRFYRKDAPVIRSLCQKQGALLHIREKQGIFWQGRALLHRWVLVSGFFLGLILSLYLPTRVLFFSVEGNVTLPQRQILEAAEDCGIRFGASRREVRSERMKNALLQAMPELKWAGVNTSGCTAVISVREREPEPRESGRMSVSGIVASRDGYITACTATRGNLLCAPGQVVREGQLLISGFTDCGICIRAEAAKGEVYARTSRSFSAVTPCQRAFRVREGERRRFFSLILGKKRINFWKDSGIWDATCGRMYEEYYITLPGGFRLPIALGMETLTHWDVEPMPVPEEEARSDLTAFAREQVIRQMTAGSICAQRMALTQEEGLWRLQGDFLCEEMIGRVITQEIGETNGKTD